MLLCPTPESSGPISHLEAVPKDLQGCPLTASNSLYTCPTPMARSFWLLLPQDLCTDGPICSFLHEVSSDSLTKSPQPRPLLLCFIFFSAPYQLPTGTLSTAYHHFTGSVKVRPSSMAGQDFILFHSCRVLSTRDSAQSAEVLNTLMNERVDYCPVADTFLGRKQIHTDKNKKQIKIKTAMDKSYLFFFLIPQACHAGSGYFSFQVQSRERIDQKSHSK